MNLEERKNQCLEMCLKSGMDYEDISDTFLAVLTALEDYGNTTWKDQAQALIEDRLELVENSEDAYESEVDKFVNRCGFDTYTHALNRY